MLCQSTLVSKLLSRHSLFKYGRLLKIHYNLNLALLKNMILPRPSYSCPDCMRKCTSASGLTRHRNASHRPLTPALDDEGDDAGEIFTYHRHPNLTGKAFCCFLLKLLF